MSDDAKFPNFEDLAEVGDDVTVYYSAKRTYSGHYYAELSLAASGVLRGTVIGIDQDQIDIRLDESYATRYVVQVIGNELDGLV